MSLSSKTRRRSWTYFGSDPLPRVTAFIALPMTLLSTSQMVVIRASPSLLYEADVLHAPAADADHGDADRVVRTGLLGVLLGSGFTGQGRARLQGRDPGRDGGGILEELSTIDGSHVAASFSE